MWTQKNPKMFGFKVKSNEKCFFAGGGSGEELRCALGGDVHTFLLLFIIVSICVCILLIRGRKLQGMINYKQICGVLFAGKNGHTQGMLMSAMYSFDSFCESWKEIKQL